MAALLIKVNKILASTALPWPAAWTNYFWETTKVVRVSRWGLTLGRKASPSRTCLSRRAIAALGRGLRGHSRHQSCEWRVQKRPPRWQGPGSRLPSGMRWGEDNRKEPAPRQLAETCFGCDRAGGSYLLCLVLVSLHPWQACLPTSKSISLWTSLCFPLCIKRVTEHLWNRDSCCLQTLSAELLACINVFIPIPFLNKKQPVNHSHPNVTELLLI